MHLIVLTWLALSLIGFAVAIMLLIEVRRDQYALRFRPEPSRYLSLIARSDLGQEAILLVTMSLGVAIGVMAEFAIAGDIIAPALVIFLLLAVGQGVFRLVMRKRMLNEDD